MLLKLQVKQFEKNDNDTEQLYSKLFLNEINHLSELKNRRIVRLHAFQQKDDRYFMIMEYCQNHSLKNLLDKEDLTQNKIDYLFYEICKGVSYLQKQKIVHCDLHPRNILINKKGQIKICDFSWATTLGEKSFKKQYQTNCEYLPPETFELEDEDDYIKPSFAIDIWSLGLILYEMITGEQPFYSQSRFLVAQNIKKMNLKWNLFDEKRKFMIQKILNPNPKKRPTINDILKFAKGICIKNQQKEKLSQALDIITQELNAESDSNDDIQQQKSLKFFDFKDLVDQNEEFYHKNKDYSSKLGKSSKVQFDYDLHVKSSRFLKNYDSLNDYENQTKKSKPNSITSKKSMQRTNSKNILKKNKLSKKTEKYFKTDNSMAKNKNQKKKIKQEEKTSNKKNIKSVKTENN